MISEHHLYAAVAVAQHAQDKAQPDIIMQFATSPVVWTVVVGAGGIFGGWFALVRFLIKSGLEVEILTRLKDEKGPFPEAIVKAVLLSQQYKELKALTEKSAEEVREVKSTVNSIRSEIQQTYEQRERISEQLTENREQMQEFAMNQQAFAMRQEQAQKDLIALQKSNRDLDKDLKETNKQLAQMNGNVQRILGHLSKDQGLS